MAPKITPRVLAIGGALYIATSSATYLYLKNGKPSPCSCQSHSASSTSTNGLRNSTGTFDRIAGDYDEKINVDELLMGVKLLRRFLIKEAKGDVLEVSAGTGRNLTYYSRSPEIKSVTLTDASREMLLRAHEKYSAAASEREAKMKNNDKSVPKTSFLLADVENLCKETRVRPSADQPSADSLHTGTKEATATTTTDGLQNSKPQLEEPITRFGPALKTLHQFSPNTYDTVIDTFGLCSCANPVKALREMAKALKPGGQLLLLEHGRSTWDFINNILDSSAETHFEKWGCRWNRDIEGLVKEAGLEITSMERWHFGTTFVIRISKEGKVKEGRKEVTF